MQTLTNNKVKLINNVNPVFISDKLNYALLQPKSLIYKELNKILKNKKITNFEKIISSQFIEKQNISKILTVRKTPQNWENLGKYSQIQGKIDTKFPNSPRK